MHIRRSPLKRQGADGYAQAMKTAVSSLKVDHVTVNLTDYKLTVGRRVTSSRYYPFTHVNFAQPRFMSDLTFRYAFLTCLLFIQWHFVRHHLKRVSRSSVVDLAGLKSPSTCTFTRARAISSCRHQGLLFALVAIMENQISALYNWISLLSKAPSSFRVRLETIMASFDVHCHVHWIWTKFATV